MYIQYMINVFTTEQIGCQAESALIHVAPVAHCAPPVKELIFVKPFSIYIYQTLCMSLISYVIKIVTIDEQDK